MAGIDATHLAKVMEKDGSTIASLAPRVGVSRQYLGDIVAGRRTLKRNPELIGKLAEALNVPKSMIEHRADEAA